LEQFQTAAPMLRRRVALAGVAMLAAIVLASCVVAWSSSRTVLESGLAMAPPGMKLDWQALMYANPGMTPAEAKMQAQLMEEGSITIDPNSENAAADFYKNSESSDIGDNDEVEDAGPGNHLGGWYILSLSFFLSLSLSPLSATTFTDRTFSLTLSLFLTSQSLCSHSYFLTISKMQDASGVA
jgi:hypothetical protein